MPSIINDSQVQVQVQFQESDGPAQQAPADGINIIIPIGGIGSRFSQDGYRWPKPLINIVGKPMICWLIDHLHIGADDTVWVAVNEGIDDEFMFGQMLRKWMPRLNIRMVRLKFQTKGAVETLFVVTQSMPEEALARRTISLDCDTIYFCDVLARARDLPAQHGACLFFEDEGMHPIFSYIKTSPLYPYSYELITEIQEKKAISNKANSGAYVFPSGTCLRDWAANFLDSMLLEGLEQHAGEYYTSQLIKMMIVCGEKFLGIPISPTDFSCVGTPVQLRQFLRRIRQQGKTVGLHKRRFCFDLDGTLVGFPTIPGDYSTCPPVQKNIELVRALHAAGHHIIIQTARRMKTHNGNVGAVIRDVATTTIDSLAQYGIPYDELYFGKPWADIYVDDLAVNATLDTCRELGWVAEDDLAVTSNLLAEVKSARSAGMVASRVFNHIQVVGEKIIKSSKSEQILGEIYFYCFMPPHLADLFPKVSSVEFIDETTTYSITMQKLAGTSYSQLLVGRSLTGGRLHALLSALRRVHTAPSEPTCKLPIPSRIAELFESHAATDHSIVDIYANYGQKLTGRYKLYQAEYDQFGFGRASQVLETIVYRLKSYTDERRGLYAPVIHGDPVFSNAILDEISRQVYLIDIRSRQGRTLTTAGDIVYDLAKVLQSLNGYDHVIMADDERFIGQEAESVLRTVVPDADRVLLKKLQDYVFWPWVDREFGERVRKQDVLDVMASLLFSLIPLHGPLRQPVFFRMCQNVLKHSMACPV